MSKQASPRDFFRVLCILYTSSLKFLYRVFKGDGRRGVDMGLQAHPLDFQANDFDADMILGRIRQPLKL